MFDGVEISAEINCCLQEIKRKKRMKREEQFLDRCIAINYSSTQPRRRPKKERTLFRIGALL